jgi:outer membrane lipoprotein LolB
MRPPSRLVLLFGGALSLTGCATLTGRPPEGPANEAAWQARLERLQTLDDWELSGRVGVINGKDGGSGSLDWKQQGEQLIFDFSGPLGSGAIHIQGDASALRVQSSRGDDFITNDPEQDFGEHLHMPMPVFSMRYWQLGIPDPGVPYTKTADAQGEPVSLEQRGWEVDYQEYAEVQGYSLPVRFTLSRGDVRIKVAVNTWNLPPAAPPTTP